MIGKFFDTSVLTPFIISVVDELVKSCPPARMHDESRQQAKRLTKVDARIRLQVDRLASSTRLNFYQKAKLGTSLEAALEAAGYSAEFRKPFAYGVVKLLAVASSQRP